MRPTVVTINHSQGDRGFVTSWVAQSGPGIFDAPRVREPGIGNRKPAILCNCDRCSKCTSRPHRFTIGFNAAAAGECYSREEY